MASRALFREALGYCLAVACFLSGCLILAGVGRWSLGVALLAFAAIGAAALAGLAHHPFPRFGAANAVTLTRAAVIAGLAGIGLAEAEIAAMGKPLAAIAFGALLLDGIDGWLARRSGMASRYGARFDMEIDALAVLVLALLVARSGRVAAWVLALGLARYAFLAAGKIWPALAAPLPPRLLRRAVCLLVIAALALALAPLPDDFAVALCVAAGLALIYSFGSDCVWLLRAARMERPVPRLHTDAVSSAPE